MSDQKLTRSMEASYFLQILPHCRGQCQRDICIFVLVTERVKSPLLCLIFLHLISIPDHSIAYMTRILGSET